MISYKVSPGELKTFSVPGKPFLSFDQYLNVVRWYRDYHYAADNVADYGELAGKVFSVWTVRQNARYHRHIWFDELKNDVTITFKVPYLDRNATFPLTVEFHTADGHKIFSHFQELAVERVVDGRPVLSSWRRIPQLRDFLIREAALQDSLRASTGRDRFDELSLAG